MLSPAKAKERLNRLDGYLLEDPSNQNLLDDAFTTALKAGLHSDAERYIDIGHKLDSTSISWQMRKGELYLAQKNYASAQELFTSIATLDMVSPELVDVALHNMAYCDLRLGQWLLGIQKLNPQLSNLNEAENPTILNSHLQSLWLRLHHQASLLQQAMEWVKAMEAASFLSSEAAGVASLIALDAEEFSASIRWTQLSLANSEAASIPMEAWVAKATIDLAKRDSTSAKKALARAFEINANDGRTWSAQGFAFLLEQQLTPAHSAFVNAITNMPNHVGTWHGLGWTQFLMNDFQAAQATFETAIALDRNFAESHGALAVVLVVQRKIDAAKEYVERANRLDKTCVSSRYAEALISGAPQDLVSIRKLASRLLSNRKLPTGEKVEDVFNPKSPR
jgi:tetratricopeptide (TPR) repeat protein